MNMGAHFGGDDGRHGRFAKSRRTSQQQMVCGLTAPTCRLEHDVEMFFQFSLTNEFVQGSRS